MKKFILLTLFGIFITANYPKAQYSASQLKGILSNKDFSLVISTNLSSVIRETWNYFWLCENGVFQTREQITNYIVGVDEITKTKIYYGTWDIKNFNGNNYFIWKVKKGEQYSHRIIIQDGIFYMDSKSIKLFDNEPDECNGIYSRYLNY